MSKNHGQRSIILTIVIINVITILIFAALLSASSLIILNISMDSKYYIYLIFIVIFLSHLFTGIITSKKFKSKKLLVSLVLSLLLLSEQFILILSLNQANLTPQSFFIIVAAAIGVLAGSLIGIKVSK